VSLTIHQEAMSKSLLNEKKTLDFKSLKSVEYRSYRDGKVLKHCPHFNRNTLHCPAGPAQDRRGRQRRQRPSPAGLPGRSVPHGAAGRRSSSSAQSLKPKTHLTQTPDEETNTLLMTEAVLSHRLCWLHRTYQCEWISSPK